MINPFKEQSSINPQRDDGNRQISTCIFRHLMKAELSGSEFRIVMAIIDKTWGYNKLSDCIPISQFVEETGLKERIIKLSIKTLKHKKVIFYELGEKIINGSRVNEFMFNKHFDTWETGTIKNIHPSKDQCNKLHGCKELHQCNKLHQSEKDTDIIDDNMTGVKNCTGAINYTGAILCQRRVQEIAHSIENISIEKKHTLAQNSLSESVSFENLPNQPNHDDSATKKSTRTKKPSSLSKELSESFGQFWNVWPKRVARKEAEKAWLKINPQNGTVEQILSAIEKFKATDQWQKNNGQFIPHPSTWLNQERWKDEINVNIEVKQPENDWSEWENL